MSGSRSMGFSNKDGSFMWHEPETTMTKRRLRRLKRNLINDFDRMDTESMFGVNPTWQDKAEYFFRKITPEYREELYSWLGYALIFATPTRFEEHNKNLILIRQAHVLSYDDKEAMTSLLMKATARGVIETYHNADMVDPSKLLLSEWKNKDFASFFYYSQMVGSAIYEKFEADREDYSQLCKQLIYKYVIEHKLQDVLTVEKFFSMLALGVSSEEDIKTYSVMPYSFLEELITPVEKERLTVQTWK